MLTLEQIQKDIQDLPEEAQTLLMDFIQVLKKRYAKSDPLTQIPPSSDGATLYEKFEAIGLVGCVSLEADLSTTYKALLFDELRTKHDHH